MAASSPYDSAAAMVSRPVMTQDISSHPALPSCRDISAATMKMPEPIIEPATIMVESKRPRLRFSSLESSRISHRYQSNEIGQFMQRYNPSRRILHGQAPGLVGIVHHQNGVDANALRHFQPLRRVREKHRPFRFEGCAIESAYEEARL